MKIRKKIFASGIIATLTLAGCESTTRSNQIYNYNPKDATEFTSDANKMVADSPAFANTIDFTNAERGFIARRTPLIICPGGEQAPESSQGWECTNEDGDGNADAPVWSLEEYSNLLIESSGNNGKFNFNEAPGIATGSDDDYTVNPSLWRNAQLNMYYGLYKVWDADGDEIQEIETGNNVEKGDIYQVRGYDLSNITFVKGENGWIVFDPLISPETAKAALDLVDKNLGKYDVNTVIYSHSHTDHYGGVSALLDSNKKKSNLTIYAPEGFSEEAISENVIAGNAMGRRAVYMYGSLLDRSAKGSVNAGLGMTTSTGVPGLILPDKENIISEETESLPTDNCWTSLTDQGLCPHDIDGVAMIFQMTPGTEAPAEMNTWLPHLEALWMAENTTNTMHNILTLRGAKVRDALLWAKYINETIDLYADKAKVKFQSHHWPVWDDNNSGNGSEIRDYLEKQRDVYKFMHDQTVRLMNKGYNGEEISEMMELPEVLENNWPTRGYYGTLKHNSRAIYQYYMGWYNSHPSDLNNLPDLQASIRYVDLMGGANTVTTKAQEAFDKGEYRWVAELLKQVVFAYQAKQFGYSHGYSYCTSCNETTTDEQAKLFLADTLEQLGYQAESGPWRSEYLQGAIELRAMVKNNDDDPQNDIIKPNALETATPDVIEKMSVDMLLDLLAIQVNASYTDSYSRDVSIRLGISNVLPDSETCNSSIFSYENDDTVCEYDATIKNSVLNYTTNISSDFSGKNAYVYMRKATLSKLATGELLLHNADTTATKHEVDTSSDDDNKIYITGMTSTDVPLFLGSFDIPHSETEKKNSFWFDIITPNKPFDLIEQ